MKNTAKSLEDFFCHFRASDSYCVKYINETAQSAMRATKALIFDQIWQLNFTRKLKAQFTQKSNKTSKLVLGPFYVSKVWGSLPPPHLVCMHEKQHPQLAQQEKDKKHVWICFFLRNLMNRVFGAHLKWIQGCLNCPKADRLMQIQHILIL